MKHLPMIQNRTSLIFVILLSILFGCSSDDVPVENPKKKYHTPLDIVSKVAGLKGGEPTLDENGSLIEPNQLVVFSNDASFSSLSEIDKLTQLNKWGRAILNNDNIVTIDSLFKSVNNCLCGGELAVASLDNDLTKQLGGVVSVGDKLKTRSGGVVETSPNFTVFSNEFKKGKGSKNFVDGIRRATNDAIVIAVLDTGIDPSVYGNLKENVWSLPADKADSLCLTDYNGFDASRFNGLDLVDEDFSPYDEHSHGTHVSGIIVTQLETIAKKTNERIINYRIMPVRTHNKDGLGTYFNALCGIYYAADMNADLINASWGFYGLDNSSLMRKALKYANDRNTYMIAALGNSSLNVSTRPHVPSYLSSLSNVISVGARDEKQQLCSFSNYYSNQKNTILALGLDIESFVPSWKDSSNVELKSGTSMATPHVTAVIAHQMFKNGKNNRNSFRDAENFLLNTDYQQRIRGNNYIIFDLNQYYP